MERKKKKCKDCGEPSYIKGHGRCSRCYSIWYAQQNPDKRLKRTPLKRKPLKRRGKGLSRPKKVAPKKTRKQKLIAKLDKVFSLITRLGAADENGVCKCYTCDKPLSWKRGAVPGLESAQAAHYLSRKFMATRWYKPNVHPGCNECNVIKHGNLEEYEKRLRRDFGESRPDHIWAIATTHHKFTEAELVVLLRKLDKEYRELKKEKDL